MAMADMQRLELIIERMALKRACRVLEAADLTGYTILPALGGYGGDRRWMRDTDISGSGDMVVVVTIGRPEYIEPALEQLESLLGAHIGVLNVTSCRVLRAERF